MIIDALLMAAVIFLSSILGWIYVAPYAALTTIMNFL
ncbi:Uncharacterised protein [Yersinia aldovae]|nr:Uncharacterised protein [Yersinia aldovae]